MTNDDASRYERGAAKVREVYAGDVVEIPEGANAFNDVMLRTLFAEVWDRDEVLDIRSRRLLIMGVIAARGQVDTWKIQARAALKRRELTPEELAQVNLSNQQAAAQLDAANVALANAQTNASHAGRLP